MSLPSMHSPSIPQPKNWFALTVFIVGTSALLMFATTEWIRERFVAGVEQVRTIDKIQINIAISHLWVEEFVTGDIVDKDEIRQNIEESTRLLEYFDDRAKKDYWLLNSAEQSAAVASVAMARKELADFAAISQQRMKGFQLTEDVGIGSEADAQFDAVFSRMFTALHKLSRLHDAALARSDEQTKLLVSAIIVAWLLLISMVTIMLRRRERRRYETEMVLHETESQLAQSQKMDAVGRLAGGIAHDINNHLAAITMQCEIVKLKAVKGDTISDRMDAIIGIGEKSTGLIRRLLAFSRKQPIQPEIVQMEKIVKEMEKMLIRLIGEDIQLGVRCQEELWNVLIDPSQLEQILLNLILNARDAMPGGGEITVSIENQTLVKALEGSTSTAPPGQYVIISVSDQGTGITSSILDKIYEPFFTTKHLSRSSGLGLATVHGIVKQNKGYIELDTQQDVGTTFRIALPRSSKAPAARIYENSTNIQRAGIAKTILLVEDNQELREGTSEILTELGYSVLVARDGKRALKIFKKSKAILNLVITDVVMPGMGGKELADVMLKLTPDLPIIFMSGYTDDVILRHGVEAGEVDFLPKPFTAANLAKTVGSVLSQNNNSGRNRFATKASLRV